MESPAGEGVGAGGKGNEEVRREEDNGWGLESVNVLL